MLTYEKLKDKLSKANKEVIVTVVQLPGGAIETLVNYMNLEVKKDYLLGAYDNDLRLKTCKEIVLLDCIVISKSDMV